MTEVMERYEDARTASFSLNTGSFYKSVGAGHGKNESKGSAFIRPSLSDFICDVEIAAREVLSKIELQFFTLVYIEQEQLTGVTRDTVEFKNTDNAVTMKLGRELTRRKIFPVSRYFAGIEAHR